MASGSGFSTGSGGDPKIVTQVSSQMCENSGSLTSERTIMIADLGASVRSKV